MQKQQERPVIVVQETPNQGEARQPWQRPTLQSLHVSLDTANGFSSDGDALSGSETG